MAKPHKPPADDLCIDSHKLFHHTFELEKWQRGEEFYPIYVELSASGACNHRCTFCALDYLGYAPRFLSLEVFGERIREMGRLGVKSILFGGEGEPLLNREFPELLECAVQSSIDAALTTNGVLMTPELLERIAPNLSWIKVSLNAGTARTYAALHRTREEDFEKAFANIHAAAELIKARGLKCVLGVQSILLPENAGELELLAARAKEAGAAYLAVKSFSQHTRSINREYGGIDYDPYLALENRLNACDCDSFRVIFRATSMRKLVCGERGFDQCLALPFLGYVDSRGTLWGCGAYVGDERFDCGSLTDHSFEELWHGEKRRKMLEFVARGLNPAQCRQNCRMDEINRFLWMLTHPPAHTYFI